MINFISLKIRTKISEETNDNLLRFFIESGEMDYLGELYRRFIPLVYGLCLKYLQNTELTQDAVMDIFTLLVEKVRHYEIQNFNSWLYSVAKNHCLLALRKEKNINFVNIESAFVENQDVFTLIDKPQTQEEIDALEYCVKTLSDDQRMSIQLFYFDEKSYADIVEVTGYELTKVKSYIQNGKRNLKNCMTKVLNLA